MAVLKHKQRFVIVVLLLLSGVSLLIAYFLHTPFGSGKKGDTSVSDSLANGRSGLRTFPRDPMRLPKQTSVENELKIDVEPVLVSDDKVQFEITLASYQNSESVAMNPLETTILLDEEDNPYEPVGWEVSHEDEYNKVGVLTFAVAHFPERLKLSVFELEERVFEWSVSGSVEN